MISTVINTRWNIQVVMYRDKERKKKDIILSILWKYKHHITQKNKMFYFGRCVTIVVVVVVHEYVVIDDVVFDCT